MEPLIISSHYDDVDLQSGAVRDFAYVHDCCPPMWRPLKGVDLQYGAHGFEC